MEGHGFRILLVGGVGKVSHVVGGKVEFCCLSFHRPLLGRREGSVETVCHTAVVCSELYVYAVCAFEKHLIVAVAERCLLVERGIKMLCEALLLGDTVLALLDAGDVESYLIVEGIISRNRRVGICDGV